MSTKTPSLTDGCAAVLRVLSPRIPDALLIAGAACFGVGVWSFDPRAVWLYAGSCCIWLAFAVAANMKAAAAEKQA